MDSQHKSPNPQLSPNQDFFFFNLNHLQIGEFRGSRRGHVSTRLALIGESRLMLAKQFSLGESVLAFTIRGREVYDSNSAHFFYFFERLPYFPNLS